MVSRGRGQTVQIISINHEPCLPKLPRWSKTFTCTGYSLTSSYIHVNLQKRIPTTHVYTNEGCTYTSNGTVIGTGIGAYSQYSGRYLADKNEVSGR